MTNLQIKRAAQVVIQLYKFSNERDIYKRYLQAGVMMEEDKLDPSESIELLAEDKSFLDDIELQLQRLRAEYITLTRGMREDEVIAMWFEERKFMGYSYERMKEFNTQLSREV